MMVGAIDELRLMAVLDRGVPNKECVAIRVDEDTNLGQYGLMVGVSGGAKKGAWPLKDNLLWFGDGWIRKGDWLFVYTGPGSAESSVLDSGETMYSIHWGRKKTVFHAKQLVPILFRLDAVNVNEPPGDVASLALGNGQT